MNTIQYMNYLFQPHSESIDSNPDYMNFYNQEAMNFTINPYGYFDNQPTSEWKKNLTPGHRFKPYDEELLKHYLLAKVEGKYIFPEVINEDIDVHQCHPSKLPSGNIYTGFLYSS
ncbi:NAC domain superfamily [Forsythia ovata]|uniref:NAC domain superfamily n=1 Tax=Forsythia ovata TaxID=205694 RepID=A0ABD1S2Z0_9LAMI